MKLLQLALVAICMVFSTSASATSVQELTTQSGEKLFVIKCSRNADRCQKKATSSCNGPYQTIDSESHSGGLLSDRVPGGPVTWYSMAVRCTSAPGRAAKFPTRGPGYFRPSDLACYEIGSSVLCVAP
jgi:hypothetical protein